MGSRRYFFLTTGLVGIFLLAANIVSQAIAQDRRQLTDPTRSQRLFTLEELAAFDGRDGRPAYFAYQGKIYDVTASSSFKGGEHYTHLAGRDLTDRLQFAPHAAEVLAAFPIVGSLAGATTRSKEPVAAVSATGWFRPGKLFGRTGATLILGKRISAWTGYLLGLLFFLNFSTCFSMPWSRIRLKRWGRLLTSFHRPLAYATLIMGIIHGVLGILSSFGIPY